MKNNLINNIDVHAVIELVRNTGELLSSLQGQVSHEIKSDGSPVSDADFKANDMLLKGLADLTPDIPIVSEECSDADNKKAAKSSARWVTDPLDGTRSFLHGREGYGCHLALVVNDMPVLGIVALPSKDKNKSRLYYTDTDGKAYKQIGNNTPVEMSILEPAKDKKLTAAIGWKDQTTDICGTDVDFYPAVGGGRMCVCAEGKTDLALFDGYFSDWDLAAAHAILRSAGGELYNKNTGQPIRYTSDDFIVPPSIAGHPDAVKNIIKPCIKKPVMPPARKF